MKLAIVGSRTITDYNYIKKSVDDVIMDNDYSITEIVSGGAKGVDTLAEQYANENKIKIIIFKPDWKSYGKSAGMLRNQDIIQYADIVIAFIKNNSKGTLNSISWAKKLKKQTFIFGE